MLHPGLVAASPALKAKKITWNKDGTSYFGVPVKANISIAMPA
jgi:GH43 family beta-xylosidase